MSTDPSLQTIPTETSLKRSTPALLGRLVVYTVLVFAFVLLVPVVFEGNRGLLTEEHGLVENLQLGLLVGGCLTCLAGAGSAPALRNFFLVLASFYALVAVRELDAALDTLIPVLGWKVGFLFPLAAGAMAWRSRPMLWKQSALFAHTGAFGILWGAFVILMPFAQIVGNGAFLRAVMGADNYVSGFKRVVEETGETLGCYLLLVGAIEAVFQMRRLDLKEERLAEPGF